MVSLRTKSNLEPSARYKHIEKSLSESKLPDWVMDADELTVIVRRRSLVTIYPPLVQIAVVLYVKP
jgi:hypothetical protein